jgi:hypothetical protein
MRQGGRAERSQPPRSQAGSFVSSPIDRALRHGEVDASALRVDVRDLVEADCREAVGKQDSPPDEDLVRMVGVRLVADALEHADLSAVEGDDAKILRVRQSRAEPDDFLPFALRRFASGIKLRAPSTDTSCNGAGEPPSGSSGPVA